MAESEVLSDSEIAALVEQLSSAVLDKNKVAKFDRKQITEMLTSALQLARDKPNTLNLKIANAALTEMREAFAMFAPYTERKKVTIFGSARTTKDDPLYKLTEQVAKALADNGWMVVTGAGPGIMEAGMSGAGREMSIGVPPWRHCPSF